MSKLSIIEALQKTIQAIKQWLPLTPGDGTSSIVQDGNQAFATNSTALGYNTIAGSKGYRISAFTPGDKDENGNYINGTYTLVLNRGEIIPQEIIKSTYCIYLKQSKDSVGTISAINGNVITVDGFLYPAKWDEGEWEELDENGHKTGNTLTGEAWEKEKAKAFAASYIIFEGLPTIGNINVGTGAHAEGWENIATQEGAHAEGSGSKALGKYAHAEGASTDAYYSAHSEGKYAKATGYHSHAEGYQTKAEGMDSHAEGRTTKAVGQDAHAEGISTIAEGVYSHAEGQNTLASGVGAHAEGSSTQATGTRTHAEGQGTLASGTNAHAEGSKTKAIGNNSHAEGQESIAYGSASHAGGMNSTTGVLNEDGTVKPNSGAYALAHGYYTSAQGKGSVALGRDTIATEDYQTVVGSFNDPTAKDAKDARFVVGIGDLPNRLKNGFTVYKDGRAAVLADPKNPLDVVTKQYVDNNIPEEFTAIIDVTSNMTLEDIQYLIDGVKGTLVLNFIDYLEMWGATLNFPYYINEVYITGMCPGITLHGRSSSQKIFCQNGNVENATISNFGKVYDAQPAGYIQYCDSVYDSYVQYKISDCDQLIRSGTTAGAGGSGTTKISNCNSLIDCFTDLSAFLNEQLTISNCGRIDNFSITCWDTEWVEEPYIHFDNCNFVSNVYLTSNSNTHFDIQYNNCKQIHNCYGHPDESITQEDLSELTRSLFPDAHNSGNWVKGDSWYTVAQSPTSIHTPAGLFKIVARSQPAGGAWTIAYILVSSVFSQTPEILVLSSNHKKWGSNVLIDKVRVVTPISSSNGIAHLQVHVHKAFTGAGKNGVSITDGGYGAEITIISMESIVDTDVDWIKRWTVGVNTEPYELDGSKYFVVEKSLEDKLTQAVLKTSNGTAKINVASTPADDDIVNAGYVNDIVANIKPDNPSLVTYYDSFSEGYINSDGWLHVYLNMYYASMKVTVEYDKDGFNELGAAYIAFSNSNDGMQDHSRIYQNWGVCSEIHVENNTDDHYAILSIPFQDSETSSMRVHLEFMEYQICDNSKPAFEWIINELPYEE